MVRLVIQRHSSGNAENRVNRWVMEFDKGQDVAAREYVRENFSPQYAHKLLFRLVDPDIGRDICICRSCSPHVKNHKLQPSSGTRLCDYAVDPVKWWTAGDDEAVLMQERHQHESNEKYEDPMISGEDAPGAPVADRALDSPLVHPTVTAQVLGFPVHEFAEAVFSLTDSEEMVLALVHPLVQVYTIPRTGQLAYVGHVCNFRQKPLLSSPRCRSLQKTCHLSWFALATSRISRNEAVRSKLMSTKFVELMPG